MRNDYENLLALSRAIKKKIVISYPDIEGNWTAHLEGAEVKEGYILTFNCGRGQSPNEAVSSYWDLIAGKTLLFNAMDEKERYQVFVPKYAAGNP